MTEPAALCIDRPWWRAVPSDSVTPVHLMLSIDYISSCAPARLLDESVWYRVPEPWLSWVVLGAASEVFPRVSVSSH